MTVLQDGRSTEDGAENGMSDIKAAGTQSRHCQLEARWRLGKTRQLVIDAVTWCTRITTNGHQLSMQVMTIHTYTHMTCQSWLSQHLLLAHLMGQYCFAGWRLSSVVICNAAGVRAGHRARGWSVRQQPGAWAVGRPTLHGGPVRLRPVRETPCYLFIIYY